MYHAERNSSKDESKSCQDFRKGLDCVHNAIDALTAMKNCKGVEKGELCEVVNLEN